MTESKFSLQICNFYLLQQGSRDTELRTQSKTWLSITSAPLTEFRSKDFPFDPLLSVYLCLYVSFPYHLSPKVSYPKEAWLRKKHEGEFACFESVKCNQVSPHYSLQGLARPWVSDCIREQFRLMDWRQRREDPRPSFPLG